MYGKSTSQAETEAELKLSLKVNVTKEVTVIYCKGRIVFGMEAAALFGKVEELVSQTRQIIIDLSGVETIDGAGLGGLVSAGLSARSVGCSIKIVAPDDFIRRVLTLTKLASVFEVHRTLAAATPAASQQSAWRPRVNFRASDEFLVSFV